MYFSGGMAFAAYCVMFYLFIHSISAQNVLSCPEFTEGANDSIKLTVTKSAFSSPTPCTLPPTSVTFYFQPENKGTAIWCTAQYTPCPNTGTPLPACRNCTCGCESDDNTTIVFGLHFTPSAADHGGTFSSEVNCLNSGSIPPRTDVNCDSISVVPPATTPPNTTIAAPTTPPPNTTSGGGTTTATTESPSSNTATSVPSTQHTGNNTTSSPSEAATETTGDVSSEPSSSPSSISGPTTTSTENGSSNKTTGNVGSTTGPASDLALYAGLGFVGLVCLVGIVVVIVLIVRRRKRRKDLATNSGNHSSPDQSGENNYTYINNTAL